MRFNAKKYFKNNSLKGTQKNLLFGAKTSIKCYKIDTALVRS